MFSKGIDKSKKKQDDFDLEKELKSNPATMKATRQQIETRIQTLKNSLRAGEDRESFDKSQVLLHGYMAAQKVVNRMNAKIG
jgi:hypothetical protein